MEKILNVVVCYANEEEIVKYLGEIEKQCNVNDLVLVITVNKISNEQNYTMLKNKLDKSILDSYIYEAEENIGYLNGLFFGYRKYSEKGDIGSLKYVIFSNTDIEYKQKDFLQTLLLKDYEKDVVCIGPSVYDIDKKGYRNPYILKRFTRMQLLYRKIILRMSFLSPIISYNNKRKVGEKKDSLNSQFTYAVHGSCFILKPEIIPELFQHAPWELLYGEELLLAEVIRLKNKKCYYDSSLNIIHESGTVTSKEKEHKNMKRMARANDRILKEFY